MLIGWAAIAALTIAADLYLRRFRIDVEDNLLARKHVTQVRMLMRAADVLVVIVTVGAALMTFDSVRQYGVSLFASAGVAGIVVGLAARPLLSNLIAGMQIAMTQPIRIDDAVVVEGEWGTVEEITATYVVVRLWDLRRLIVPLTYFIEKPFQNWTREGAGPDRQRLLYVDYTAPVDGIRAEAQRDRQASPHWDGKVVELQVTDAKEADPRAACLVSARIAGKAFDLRCEVREKLIDFLQQEHPSALCPGSVRKPPSRPSRKPRLQRPRRQYATRRVAPPKAKPPLCCSACCVFSKPLVILPRNSSGAGSRCASLP